MTTQSQEIKALKQELAALKNEFADQLEGTLSNGHSKTIFTREDIAELAHNAGRRTKRYLARKRKQMNEAKDACETTIQEHPFTSLAVGVAGGALLAALLRRK